MNSQPNLYTLALFTSALIALAVSYIVWRRRPAPGAIPLALMLISNAIWAGGSGLFLVATNSESREFLANITFVGAVWGSLALLTFALQYTGRERWLTRRNVILLCLMPAAVSILIWSNDSHRLIFITRNYLDAPTPSDELVRTPGIGFLVLLAYTYPIVLYSIGIITQAFFRSPRLYRGQAGAIWIGTLIPLVGNIIFNIIDGQAKGLKDPTPILNTAQGLIIAYGLFSFRLFEIIPIARHTLLENMTDGVLAIDSLNHIIDINPTAIRLLAPAGQSVIGSRLDQVSAAWADNISQYSAATNVKTELKLGIDPTQYFDLRIEPLFDRQKQANGKLIVFRDITEKKQAEDALQKANQQLQSQLTEIEVLQATLREQAIRDGLTGLFNRRRLDESLVIETARAMRHQHPLSILMVEIDFFKSFNDTFGHEAGDLVICKIAELIQTSTRTGDVACRYGGDEFALILPETTSEAAYQRAERLRGDVASLALEYLGKSLGKVTVSIGVANYPQHRESANYVLRAADKAMYQAKQAGKNRVEVAPSAL